MSDRWGQIKKHLEPLTNDFYTTPYDDIQLSIAISLKRIADIMQGKQQPAMMSAEEYELYNKRFNKAFMPDMKDT